MSIILPERLKRAINIDKKSINDIVIKNKTLIMEIKKNDNQYQIRTQLFKVVEHSGLRTFFKSLSHLPSETRQRKPFVIKISNDNVLEILVNKTSRVIVDGCIGHTFSGTLIKSDRRQPGGLTDKEIEEVTGTIFF